jgi:hypothetical protein
MDGAETEAIMSTPDALIDDCVHHWMLMSPKREITAAVCKYCGDERDFLDADSRLPWNSGRVRKWR